MADPLSVAASVVGLLAAAGKAYGLLETISSMRGAPSSIRDVQRETRHTEVALRALQRFLQRLDPVSERLEMIQVDELRVVLADAMLLFDSFESMLQQLASMGGLRVSISWVKYTKQLDEHLGKLERYKSSLTVMLSILQCNNDSQARADQAKLHDLVEKTLEENAQLRQKLEDSYDAAAALVDDDTSTIRGPGPSTNRQSRDVVSDTVRNSMIKFAFENILEESRVYKRTAHLLECDQSLASSAVFTVFTGYSLADISILSVVAMPLCAADVSNGQHYVVDTAPRGQNDSEDINVEMSKAIEALEVSKAAQSEPSAGESSMKLQLPERYLEPCTTTASIFLYARGSSVVCLPHDTKQMAWTFTKHSDQVQLIAVESKVDFIPQNLVVSYDASHTAIVWNLYNTGWEVPRLKFAEDEKINCLSWMRNGNVALGNVQGNVVVFDPAASQHVSIPTIDQLAITALAPADDCKTFAIGYQNGKLILATLQPRFTILHSLSTPIHLQAPSSSPVITLEWHGSPSRQKSDFLAVQADDGYLHVWSVPKARIPDSEEPARLVRFLKRPGRENYQPGRNWMSWSKGGRIIQYSNGETISWDVRTKNVTYDMIPMSRDVRGLAVYGPGAILFTLGPNHTVQKFDLNTPARFVNQIQHVSPTSSSGAQDQ